MGEDDSVANDHALGYGDSVLPRLPCNAGHGGVIFLPCIPESSSNSLETGLGLAMVSPYFPVCPVSQGMAGLFIANMPGSFSLAVSEDEFG